MVGGDIKVGQEEKSDTNLKSEVTHEKQYSTSPDYEWEIITVKERENIEEKDQHLPEKVFKIPIQLERKEGNMYQTMGKKDCKNSNEKRHIDIHKTMEKSQMQNNFNTLENVNTPNSAKNVTEMQMGDDNGSTFGMPASNQFGTPKPVRIVPIDIEINNDKLYSNHEVKQEETGNSASSQKPKNNAQIQINEYASNERHIPDKQVCANKWAQNLPSTKDDIQSTEAIGRKHSDTVTIPIQIEINDDFKNVQVEINHETNPREMTKQHFTKQTTDLSPPQQTMIHAEQKESIHDTTEQFVKGVGYIHGKSSPGSWEK